ncbi:odorant-binding protein 19c [Cochliomyia hominivorax]
MKISTLATIFSICIYINIANSRSLNSFYGNSLDHFKGQRKPLVSPFGNEIHDNYKRAKRQVSKGVLDFQEVLNNAKLECVNEMNLNPQTLEKSLLYEEFPTDQEKCLMMCMLKKTKLMENTNKLSAKTIARVASMMSENNPLVVSVAVATANNCNTMINAENPCEAAFQINKCIGGELKAHKLKLYY